MYGSVLAYVVVRSRGAVPGTAVLGALGGICLAWGLVRANVSFIPWPVAFLGTAYAIALIAHGSSVDDAAPLVAVGLLLCGELAAWSLDERFAMKREPGVVIARAAALAALAFGSLMVAALVIALASASAGAGLAWTIAGAASAVAAVAIAVALARRV